MKAWVILTCAEHRWKPSWHYAHVTVTVGSEQGAVQIALDETKKFLSPLDEWEYKHDAQELDLDAMQDELRRSLLVNDKL